MLPRLLVVHGGVPAHDLLRAEAAAFHDVPAERVVLGHLCPRCGGDDHGRPLLLPTATLRRPAHVSLARAGDRSIVALTDAAPVGVDLELEGAASFPGFDDVVLHGSERSGEGAAGDDPTRVWVRKEAALKACGTGLSVDPRLVAVSPSGRIRNSSSAALPASVRLLEIDVPGSVAAVALLLDAAADLQVEVRRAD